jgi:hypothetical protein
MAPPIPKKWTISEDVENQGGVKFKLPIEGNAMVGRGTD